MSTNVDTLRIFERLKGASLNERAAKEIAEVFYDFIESKLATKMDIEGLKIATKKDIESLRAELKVDIENLRTELKIDIEKVRAGSKVGTEKVESGLTSHIENLRAEVKVDIAQSKTEIIKWVAGMLIAQTAILASVVKLL